MRYEVSVSSQMPLCLYLYYQHKSLQIIGCMLEARGLIKYFPIKKSFRQFFKPAEPDRVVKAVDDVSFTLWIGVKY